MGGSEEAAGDKAPGSVPEGTGAAPAGPQRGSRCQAEVAGPQPVLCEWPWGLTVRGVGTGPRSPQPFLWPPCSSQASPSLGLPPKPTACGKHAQAPSTAHFQIPGHWSGEPQTAWPPSPVPIRWDRWVTGHREPAGQGPLSAVQEERLRASHTQPPVRPGDSGGPGMLAQPGLSAQPA